MPDNLSPEDRRKTMKAVKGKNTGLERKLFAVLAGMRLRGWKKHAAEVPGKPDAAFTAIKIAIFVNGCFWHGCPECQRKLPETNKDYWERKLKRNIERDGVTRQILIGDGWQVVTIWEHELRRGAPRTSVHNRIRDAMQRRPSCDNEC